MPSTSLTNFKAATTIAEEEIIKCIKPTAPTSAIMESEPQLKHNDMADLAKLVSSPYEAASIPFQMEIIE